jgi:hypothetical protein
MEARTVLFRDYAYDHRSTLYGEVSENFVNLVKERMGAAPPVFSFLQGTRRGGNGLATGGQNDRARRQ